VAAYGDSVQRVLIATSDGRWVEEERPRIRLVEQVVAARDGVIQTGFWGPAGLAGAEFFDRHPPRQTAERAARQAVAMLDGIDAPAGEMPVVMGPGGGGILFHEACGHGLEPTWCRKGPRSTGESSGRSWPRHW
jgi:TldD protein